MKSEAQVLFGTHGHFLSGALLLMGIISGEIVYPTSYSTAKNTISDLGATLPPNSIIYPLPAAIFNTTMLVSGVLIMASAYFMYRTKFKMIAAVPIALLGISVFGVGMFPGNKMPAHAIFSMAAFALGGLASMMSSTITSAPFRYLATILGLLTLSFLLLAIFASDTIFGLLGMGGTERWIAYPVIIWLIGLGAHLTAKERS